MIKFNITIPRVCSECLDRHRSLVVVYGRTTSSDEQTLAINFQGRSIWLKKASQLKRIKPSDRLDIKKIVEEMLSVIKAQSLSAGYRLGPLKPKDAIALGNLLKGSKLLQYFKVLGDGKNIALDVQTAINHKWNPTNFEFEDLMLFGEPIRITFPIGHTWEGLVPAEEQKKRRASVTEQTEEEALELIRKQLDYWLFGPIKG